MFQVIGFLKTRNVSKAVLEILALNKVSIGMLVSCCQLHANVCSFISTPEPVPVWTEGGIFFMELAMGFPEKNTSKWNSKVLLKQNLIVLTL